MESDCAICDSIPIDPMTNSKEWGFRSMQDDPDSNSWGGQTWDSSAFGITEVTTPPTTHRAAIRAPVRMGWGELGLTARLPIGVQVRAIGADRRAEHLLVGRRGSTQALGTLVIPRVRRTPRCSELLPRLPQLPAACLARLAWGACCKRHQAVTHLDQMQLRCSNLQ